MMKEKLQSIILKKGYDNERLAKKLGITKEELQLKINRKKSFTIGEIVDLTDILGIENPANIFFPEKKQKIAKKL